MSKEGTVEELLKSIAKIKKKPVGFEHLDASSGKIIIKALRKMGFTYAELTTMTGLSGAFLNNIEKHHNKPSILHEVILARQLAEIISQS